MTRRKQELDRRRAPRRRTTAVATIHVFGQRMTCSVVDISDSGAKIDIPPEWIVPPSFYLHIPGERVFSRASLVWRSTFQAGVSLGEIWARPEDHPDPAVQALFV
ncbi:MAG: PilZ domain-containing protein [Bauldia sp.]|nr:PilZ domain-containing protein [Bauldia sp.]